MIFQGRKVCGENIRKPTKTRHTLRIFDGDGLVSDVYFASIEADVREYFPDLKSVNKALRTIIY